MVPEHSAKLAAGDGRCSTRPGMRIRHPALFSAAVLFALLACKKKTEETTPSATSTPEPPPPSATTEPSAAAPTPSATDEPTSPGVTTKVSKKDGGTSDAGTSDAGTTDAGTSKDAGTTADAGKVSSNCSTKCQGVLQTCLTPTKTDSGLPKLADPAKCQAAFNDCVQACK